MWAEKNTRLPSTLPAVTRIRESTIILPMKIIRSQRWICMLKTWMEQSFSVTRWYRASRFAGKTGSSGLDSYFFGPCVRPSKPRMDVIVVCLFCAMIRIIILSVSRLCKAGTYDLAAEWLHVMACANYWIADPTRLRISGPMVMAISILIRSAGINGNTHTASAADTVYPACIQNQAVPRA